MCFFLFSPEKIPIKIEYASEIVLARIPHRSLVLIDVLLQNCGDKSLRDILLVYPNATFSINQRVEGIEKPCKLPPGTYKEFSKFLINKTIINVAKCL